MDRSDRNLLSLGIVIFLIFLCAIAFILFGKSAYAATSCRTQLYIDGHLIHSCASESGTSPRFYFGASDDIVCIRCDNCDFSTNVVVPYNFIGYSSSRDAAPFWTYDDLEESAMNLSIGGLSHDAEYHFYSCYDPDYDSYTYSHTFIYIDDRLVYVACHADDLNPSVTMTIGPTGLFDFSPEDGAKTFGGFSGSCSFDLANFEGLSRSRYTTEPDEDLKVGDTVTIPSQLAGDMEVRLLWHTRYRLTSSRIRCTFATPPF